MKWNCKYWPEHTHHERNKLLFRQNEAPWVSCNSGDQCKSDLNTCRQRIGYLCLPSSLCLPNSLCLLRTGLVSERRKYPGLFSCGLHVTSGISLLNKFHLNSWISLGMIQSSCSQWITNLSIKSSIYQEKYFLLHVENLYLPTDKEWWKIGLNFLLPIVLWLEENELGKHLNELLLSQKFAITAHGGSHLCNNWETVLSVSQSLRQTPRLGVKDHFWKDCLIF